MRLFNIRIGFATNSSSSHSIVMFDDAWKEYLEQVDPDYDGFGWEHFTLRTDEWKMKYLAAQLKNQLEQQEILDLVGVVSDMYVDHQSDINFPRTFGGKSLNHEFIKDFAQFLKRKDVAILGGNDNGESHPLKMWGTDISGSENREGVSELAGSIQLIGEHYDAPIARKDRGVWVLFSPKQGAKIRFSLDDQIKQYTYSDLPELVDIKITDYCNEGCTFCYQSSGPKGKHAPLKNIEYILDQLAAAQVFEVALGGGEPTSHPDFLTILKMARERGIVPNFSTKNEEILMGSKFLKKKGWDDGWATQFGAMGLSVPGGPDFEQRLMRIIQRIVDLNHNGFGEGWGRDNPYLPKVIIQHAVGTATADQLKMMYLLCRGAHIPLLLLGFKNVGRGSQFTPLIQNKDVGNIIQSASGESWHFLGADTTLVKANTKALKHSTMLYTPEEGMFSMYVDATTMQMGPSSFCPTEQMSPFDNDWRGRYQAYHNGVE